MLQYNKHLFFAFLMGCIISVHSMHYYHDGAIVRISKLPNSYINDVQNLDLNNTLPEQVSDDYTTEEEIDESTMQLNNKLIIPQNQVNDAIHGMPEAEYFKWFEQYIQPQISKNKIKREEWCIEKKIKEFKQINTRLNQPLVNTNTKPTINIRINFKEFEFLTEILLQAYPDFNLEQLYILYMNTSI